MMNASPAAQVRHVSLAALVLLLLVLPAAAARSVAGRPVLYLVAFDRGSGQQLPGLARTARRHGLRVHVLRSLRPPPGAVDPARRQLIAQTLIGEVRRSYPRLRTPGAVAIGLTGGDMYIRGLSWRYAFGARGTGNVGMIATRRMDPRFFGLAYDRELFRSRLDKMFVRYLGLLVLRLPTTRDPYSVLRASILSLDDLDVTTDEFTPSPPSVPERRWISGSNASCAQARTATRALGIGNGISTVPQLVRAAGGFLRIQERLLARLRTQHGRPLDRALAPRFLARFVAFNGRERSALADLRAKPDEARAHAWISLSGRASATLRVFTLRLRLLGCASYFAGG
jgi:predicted Zn-dependent protease